MESTRLWQVTHGAKSISWRPHECPSKSLVQTLATPATAWLSVGFSALCAGVSVFNAYQLAKQQSTLDLVSSKLNVMNQKIDCVLRGIERIESLTTSVLENTQVILELTYVKMYFDGARIHFDERLRNGSITSDSIRSLAGDVQGTLNQIVAGRTSQKTKKQDAPIPNWMIERASPAFSFLTVLNLHLIEAHNLLNDYDPAAVRRYVPVDGEPLYFCEHPANDAIRNQIVELQNVHAAYKTADPLAQPRLRWLSAFLWETMMASFTLSTSPVLSGAGAPLLFLPRLDSNSESGFLQATKPAAG